MPNIELIKQAQSDRQASIEKLRRLYKENGYRLCPKGGIYDDAESWWVHKSISDDRWIANRENLQDDDLSRYNIAREGRAFKAEDEESLTDFCNWRS
jgi:hypothetical protein